MAKKPTQAEVDALIAELAAARAEADSLKGELAKAKTAKTKTVTPKNARRVEWYQTYSEKVGPTGNFADHAILGDLQKLGRDDLLNVAFKAVRATKVSELPNFVAGMIAEIVALGGVDGETKDAEAFYAELKVRKEAKAKAEAVTEDTDEKIAAENAKMDDETDDETDDESLEA